MSLPRKEIAIEFLNLYEKIRQKDQKPKASDSFLTKAAEKVTNTTKFFLGQPSDKSIREQINTLIRQITELNSAEDYYRLIYDLGECAYKAQSQKINLFKNMSFTDESSLLCTVLHAIRSYIVSSLNRDDCPLKNDLQNTRARLKNEYEDLEKEIAVKRYTLQTDVSDLVKSRNDRLIRLAYLEDPHSINLLIDKDLLPLLTRFNGKSHNMIITLQKDHYLTFYRGFLQDTTRISFDEFCENAIRKANGVHTTQSAPNRETQPSPDTQTDIHENKNDNGEEGRHSPGLA